MTYVVLENCIKCKYMDCVEVCPVDCFYAGENMLVIHPDECIDCGVCEPECPANAIVADSDPRSSDAWLKLNADYARVWPNITHKGAPPTDAVQWDGVAGKLAHFSPERHREEAPASLVEQDGGRAPSSSSLAPEPGDRKETLPWRPR